MMGRAVAAAHAAAGTTRPGFEWATTGNARVIGVVAACLTIVLYLLWEYSRLTTEPQREAVSQTIARGIDRAFAEVIGPRVGPRIGRRLRSAISPRLRLRWVPPLAIVMSVISVLLVVSRFLSVQ